MAEPRLERPQAGAARTLGAAVHRMSVGVPAAASSPATGIAEALQRIDLRAIVTAQVDLVAREVPAVGALPAEVLRGPFTDAVDRAAGYVLIAFSEDRRLTETELGTVAAAFAEVMAVWDLVIDDVIATFALGARLLSETVQRYVGPEQLRAFLEAGGGALDSAALIERIAVEAETYRQRRSAAHEREARKALAAEGTDRTGPADPASPRAFVALRPDADLHAQAALAHELREAGAIAVTSDGHVVGSFPAGTVVPDVADDVLVVEAIPRPGSPDVRRGRLRSILDLACARDRRGPLTDLDLAAERLLAAAPDVTWHLREAIAAVRSASFGDELLATATAFVAVGGDVAATARTLGLHRETVRYRLGRIEASSGLELSGWRGRSTLLLALRASPDRPEQTEPPERAANAGDADQATMIDTILRRLDRDALIDRLVEHRREHQPRLAATLAATDAEAAIAAADLDDIVALLEDEHVPREQALARTGRRTFAYLRLGAAVDDIAAVGRATPRIVWRAVLAETTDDELPQLRSALGRLVLYIEGTQLAIAHAARPSRPGSGDALLDALLDPDATEQRRVALAAEFGITLDARRRAFVVAPGPAAAGRVGMDLRNAGWTAVERDGYVLGIAPADATAERLEDLVPATAVFVLGAPLAVRDLGTRIDRLRRLVALALADERTGRIDVLSATIELLLIAQPDVADVYWEAIIAPLTRRDAVRDGQLAVTLRQYVAHGEQRTATAAAMHLHPNSIDYRLGIIRKEIGRSFTSIDDMLGILLGVTADRLRSVAGEFR